MNARTDKAELAQRLTALAANNALINERDRAFIERDLAIIVALSIPVLTSIAAMVTHIIVCIKTSSWLFLLAGAIAPPIGVIHGIGVWVGAW